MPDAWQKSVFETHDLHTALHAGTCRADIAGVLSSKLAPPSKYCTLGRNRLSDSLWRLFNPGFAYLVGIFCADLLSLHAGVSCSTNSFSVQAAKVVFTPESGSFYGLRLLLDQSHSAEHVVNVRWPATMLAGLPGDIGLMPQGEKEIEAEVERGTEPGPMAVDSSALISSQILRKVVHCTSASMSLEVSCCSYAHRRLR